MTAEVDEYGNIATYQGDTIIFNCNNVPTDQAYVVYWSVRDTKSDADIIDQIPFIPTGSSVAIYVPSYITDLIPVPDGKKFKDYRHALKACSVSGYVEHTLTIGDTEVGTEYKLRVHRKQSEGTIYVEPTAAPTEEPTDNDNDNDNDVDSDGDSDTDSDTIEGGE
jgi:hypothetical protein